MNIKTFAIHHQYSYRFSFVINDLLEDWSNVNHQNTYLSPAYLKAIENSKIQNLTFVYVVMYLQEIPVGIMYFQCLEITHSFYAQGTFPNDISKKITSKMLKSICGQLIMCGNFFATGVNGFFINKEIPSSIPLEVVESLKKELKALSTPLDTRFLMFKEFWNYKDLEIQQELTQTYTPFEIDVNMVLNLNKEWKVFSDYLESMTTKYRTRAKSVYKKTVNVKEKQLTAEEIKKHKTVIERLYLSVINTASFNMVTLSVKSFYQIKQHLQDNFIFTAYFVEDKMVAFSTACATSNCLDANYVGIDYDTNETIPLYQRVLYDYVQLAIKYQVQELRLGRTAELMKSSLGAEPASMTLYLKHTHKMVNSLMKPLLKRVKPNDYELRKPFKK